MLCQTVDYLNINYDHNIFLFKDKVIKLLENLNIDNITYEKINIIIYLRNIIEKISTCKKTQNYLQNNNIIINNTDNKNIKLYNTITNINTLRIISKIIHK